MSQSAEEPKEATRVQENESVRVEGARGEQGVTMRTGGLMMVPGVQEQAQGAREVCRGRDTWAERRLYWGGTRAGCRQEFCSFLLP